MELSREEHERVTTRMQEVQRALRTAFGPKTDFISGSYGRGTSIRPLKDIDFFVVLGDIVLTPSPARPVRPSDALVELRDGIHREIPRRTQPVIQRHSVRLESLETPIQFDVIPAYACSNAPGYLIPERKKDASEEQWVRTDPRKHQDACARANQRCGGRLNPLIKLVKHWKGHHAKGLKSFHLEVMCYGFQPPRPLRDPGYLEPLEALFSHLSRAVMVGCPDPAELGGDLDDYLGSSQRAAASQLLEHAAREVRLAREEQSSRPDSAHRRMRELFPGIYRGS
ncbi:nucleotidyltransferase [Comamonas sp. JC664]|nr:nucleotidyltransferase [Comamonas sp. JC664]